MLLTGTFHQIIIMLLVPDSLTDDSFEPFFPSSSPSQWSQHVCHAGGEAPVQIASSGLQEETETARTDPGRLDREQGERHESRDTRGKGSDWSVWL